MKTGKKQHTIAYFYLNQFINPGWVYLRGSQQPKRVQSARSAAVKEWYYSQDTDDEDFSLDDVNTGIESACAPVLRELLTTKDGLPYGSKRLFSYFIANLALRVPVAIEETGETILNFMEQMDKMAKEQMEFMDIKDVGEKETEVKEDELLPECGPATGSYRYTLNGWKKELESMREEVKTKKATMPENIRLVKKLAPVIAKMGWDILDALVGGFFITSDRPVYLTNIDGTRLGAGWGNTNALGTLPLSPRRYLILHYGLPSNTWGYKRASSEEVEFLNERTIASASYAIYSPERYSPAENWLCKATG